MGQSSGKVIIFIGFSIVVIGVLVYFFSDKLRWLGNLPGDIRYQNGNTKIFFPLTTMLIISILLNIIIYLVKKFF